MTEAAAPSAQGTTLPPEALLRRMQGPGPRYTSYPTADRFHEGFGVAELEHALVARRRQSDAGTCIPMSVYVHVPFCESVCYYCACNKVITRHHERAAEYLDALELEAGLVVDQLGACRAVSQLHLGGGSPTFLSDGELGRLMGTIRRHFFLTPGAEMSIEVDPRTVDAPRLRRLHELGFNRISFGVQDFDPAVQRAVHREQPFEQVQALMRSARAIGFASINVDLIYGLPRQTPESFRRTLVQVASLRPDRIALYGYAHLPERFKPQRRIHDAELPDGPQRVAMLGEAMALFVADGYEYIGMDHFALSTDTLAIARREGRLHRNFQGYSTQADCDLIGLGVSAIGRIGDCFYQNAKTLDAYYGALEGNRLPVARGLVLDADDRLRRDIIMGLMCHGQVDFDDIRRRHGVDVRSACRDELVRLAPLAADGLVELHEGGIRVTASGWYVVRAIAMVFDRHLQAAAGRERFSRIV
ncbi:MAG TPA: oxygen-independent coproporphyrinogen III oxidase [Burkholderiaceae bacterium]